MIEEAGQDLETKRQIIRQIRVDDRSKSVHESQVNIYHEASVTSYVYEIRPKIKGPFDGSSADRCFVRYLKPEAL